MGNYNDSPLFKCFVGIVILAHGFQLVWNQPLITERPRIIPVPFHHSEEGSVRSASVGSAIFSDNTHRSLSNYHAVETMVRGRKENPREERPRRSHHHRRQAGDVGSLCSIFQTFLDSRYDHCRVSNAYYPERQENHHHNHQYEHENNRHRHNDEHIEDDDSNDLLLHYESSGRSSERRDERRHKDEDNEGGLEHDRRSPSQSLSSPPAVANKRIDHDINSEEDEDDEHDDTKQSQDRIMIIVPDRPCPPGKKRDPRGYCRRLVTIRNYPSSAFGSHMGSGLRPIKYYYSRFVSVPTLHFILR